MPFYKKLFGKIKKELTKPVSPKEKEEFTEAVMMAIPALKIARVGKVAKGVPKIAKPAWEFLLRKQIPGEILKVIKKGEKLTNHEIVKRVFAKGYRTTMEEMSGGLWELTKKGTLGKTKEVSRLIKSKELERIGKGLGVRFTETIKPARFFKK